MLRFFRLIRRKLIEEDNTRKYIYYAIGEILLVMIGILLALQVNNWNEERVLKKQELNLLYEIRENLIQSNIEIKSVLENNLADVYSYYSILDHIEKQKPLSDSLAFMFGDLSGWTSPYLTYTAYETLKQKGVDIISNKKLRDNVTMMYESYFAYLVNDWDRTEWRDNQAVVTPYVSKNFYYELDIVGTRRGRVYPNNYDRIMRDPEFKNILTLLINNREWGNHMIKQISVNLDDLIDEIDNELITRGYKLES